MHGRTVVLNTIQYNIRTVLVHEIQIQNTSGNL